MFIEPLDPRRLMAAASAGVGLDPSFGVGGRVSFPDGIALGTNIRDLFLGAQNVLIAGGGAVYVAGSGGTVGSFVARLTDAGKLDTSFGTKGYAAVPFDPVTLAYDTANGFLYVGTNSDRGSNRGTAATVTRLKADGKIDTTYGTNGTFAYTPPLPAGADANALATVEKINPLPDGSAVVAIDRQTDTGVNSVTDQNLALFKLRRDGTRDPNYGKRGVVQLLGGIVARNQGGVGYGGPNDLVDTVRRGFFSDVQTDRRGRTHVLIRYETGVVVQDSETAFLRSQEANHGRFDVKSRDVNANGVQNPDTAHSWTLFDSGTDKNTVYHVAYVGEDRHGVHALVTLRKETGTVYTDVESRIYTLRPGERPTHQVLEPNGLKPVFALTHSANGTYVAYDDAHAVRLRSNFVSDRTFARSSLATVPEYFLDGVFADDQGRFLAIDGYNTVDRFV